MHIQIEMQGITPLVMHNAQLSDPLSEVSKAIAAVSKKKRKTEDDHWEMAKLEMLGGLYLDETGPIMPAANIKRCLVKAAMLSREGKAVERALLTMTQAVPLEYQGPRDPEKIWADKRFRFRTSVRVGASRVQRTRPRFPAPWKIVSDWELMTDALDLDRLAAIVEVAGTIEGLGDHRSQGSGRFKGKVLN